MKTICYADVMMMIKINVIEFMQNDDMRILLLESCCEYEGYCYPCLMMLM